MEFLKTFGPWALVTGASSGIGREYCVQLAKLGLNLVLVARSQAKLAELSEYLSQAYQIKTRVLAVDLADSSASDVVYVHTIDLDIGLVVSNAGTADAGKFLNVSMERVRRNIYLNVSAHVELTHYFGARILDTRDGRGGILLMSSVAGMQGVPYLSAYAAAKAYVLSFGEAFHYENRKNKLHVLTVAPGATDTPMLEASRGDRRVRRELKTLNFPMMAPEDVVVGSLVALQKNKSTYVPGFINRLRVGLLGRHLLTRGANVNIWAAAMERYSKVLATVGLRKAGIQKKLKVPPQVLKH